MQSSGFCAEIDEPQIGHRWFEFTSSRPVLGGSADLALSVALLLCC